MRDIITNLRRITTLFYLLSTFICVVFILLSTSYFADDPANNQSMLVYMLKGDHSLSGLVMWHNVLSSSDMNTWLLILAPLICTVPYVYTFCIDVNTRCYIFSLNRQGLYRFLISRFLGAGIYSAMVMFSAMILSFFIAVMYSTNLGSYSDAPIAEMLVHRQSAALAFIEVCLTYIFYAFLIGIICITLASLISNAFTSCSTLVLVLFLMGDVQSSYRSRFFKKMFSGEVSRYEYNHYTDFLFVGNVAHGMPEFQNDFHMPYIIYMIAYIAVIILFYLVFHNIMKKKVIL